MNRSRLPFHALAFAVLVAGPASLSAQVDPPAGGEAGADSVRLSLAAALALGLDENPNLRQAAAERSAAGGEMWSAYGNLLPQASLTGSAQRSEQGSFSFFGTEFDSPETFSTAYQVDFIHSLLDSGRDWFRIKSARAGVDRALADYDVRTLEVASDVKTQYLNARRGAALVAQAEREIERRRSHFELAEARYDAGLVTKSDVLQARLSINQGEVEALRAAQSATEARLALRRLLGGALEPGPLALTSDFEPFPPAFDADRLVALATERHPSLREVRARERADEAGLWIARSSYLPSLQLQYSLSRSVVDTAGFQFSDFDDRDYYAIGLSWPLFSRLDRLAETSRANARLVTTRQQRRERRLAIEETVRTAHSRLMTAWAAHQASVVSAELAAEDLRLGEGRYEIGAGSFVDLLDARTRSAEAETELITTTYDFYLALVALERASGHDLFPTTETR